MCKNISCSDYVALPGQYIGSINDYQTGTSSDVVHSLSCPSDAVIIDSCQYNTTYGCQNNEEVLTCIRCEFTGHHLLFRIHVYMRGYGSQHISLCV